MHETQRTRQRIDCRSGRSTVDSWRMNRLAPATSSLALLALLTACNSNSSQREATVTCTTIDSLDGSPRVLVVHPNSDGGGCATGPMEVDVELELVEDGSGSSQNPAGASAPRIERRRMVVMGADASGKTATFEMMVPPSATVASAPSVPAVAATIPTAPCPVMIGVRMRELDPVLATHLGIDARTAAVLEDVAEELNGHAGGLRDHDVIIAVDGKTPANPSHIRKALLTKKPGDTMTFTVMRAGTKSDVVVTLQAWEHAKFHGATPARVGG